MEFVEFHAEATTLTTSSTITLPFDRSITNASDVKGVVLMAQGRVSNFGWTTISHGWSVGVYDGTNEMCKWAGATRGSTDESEYREHWYDNAILVNWDEATNDTYAVCSINSISTTGITLDVDSIAGTNVSLKIRGYAIVGSDVSCEAKSLIQSTTTSGATADLDYSTLTSADVVLGWFFDNDDITETLLPDETGGTIGDYRGHYSPGQWFATEDGTRAMWGKVQDGGSTVDTAIYQKSDGKVYCTVIDVSGTLYESYISASFQHGGTANRVRLTNDGSQSRGYGVITLAIETDQQTAIGTMHRAVSDTGTETIAPGFPGVGLVQTMSFSGFGSNQEVPDADQTNGNQYGINFGMGGNVRTDDDGVGCFGMSLSMTDANGAVRYRNVHWTAASNVTVAASEADSDWQNEVAATQFAPASTSGTTNNDLVYQYISAVDGTTGDMTVSYQDPAATGTQNKGIRTYWLAVEEGGSVAAQTVDLDTSSNEIPSAEAFGSHTVVQEQFVEPSSVSSAEAFGTHTVDSSATISSAGSIASEYASGSHTLATGSVTVEPSSIASAESLGEPVLDPTAEIVSIGIADGGEDIGSHTLELGTLTVSPSSIASEEAFGSANIHAEIAVSPTGIASAEAFETPAILKVAYPIDPTGINDGGQSFGTLVVNTFNVVLPTSITSDEAIGGATVGIGGASVEPTGIASEESMGSGNLIRTGNSIYLTDAVADSGEAFGTLEVQPGGATVEIVTNQDVKGGIVSEEAMGDNQVVGPVIVDLTGRGIASGEDFGDATATGLATIDVYQGIESEELFGGAWEITGPPAGPIQPKLPAPGGLSGIPSKEAFGSPEMVKQFPDQFPSPSSIPSAEAFGSHTIAGNLSLGASSIAESDNYYNGVSVQGSAIQVSKNGEIIPGDAPPITAGGNDFSVAFSQTGFEIRAGFTITNDPILKPDQNGIGGMESEEAFGTLNVGPGSVGNIPSAENFGTHSVVYTPQTLEPSSIASAESLGEPTIDPQSEVVAIGITDGGEDIGTAEIQPGAITLEPTGIASEEAVQEVGLDLFVQGITAIDSEEAFGTAEVTTSYTVSDAGDIASEEAVGAAEIQATISAVLSTGIASEEAFGSHELSSAITLEPTGIASEESVQEVGLDLFIQGITGIASAEGVNHPVVQPGSVTLEPTAIDSEEAFGDAEIAASYTVSDAGNIASEESVQEVGLDLFVQGITAIDSEEAFGAAEVAASYDIVDAGDISSEEAFGSIEDIELTVQGITAIDSEEAFGDHLLQPLIDIISGAGIDNGELFGEPRLNLFIQGATSIDSEEAHGTGNIFTEIDVVVPQGIDNGEAFGDPGINLTVGGISGITSDETFGAAEIAASYTISAAGDIASEEAVQEVGLNLTVQGITAIDSEEAFGTAEIAAGEVEVIAPSFIDGAEDLGTPTLDNVNTIIPDDGVESGEAFGDALIAAGGVEVVAPSFIDGAEDVGAPTLEATIDVVVTQGIAAPSPQAGVPSLLPGGVTLELAGIESEESVQEVGLDLFVQGTTGIASEEAVSEPSLDASIDLAATGIASGEAFGSAEVQPGGVQTDAIGIASEEAFGQPTLSPGEVLVELAGIESEESVSDPEITVGGVATVIPGFIDGAEDLGTPSVLPGSAPVGAAAIASEEAVAAPTLIQQITLVPVQYMNASWDEVQELDASSD